MIRIIIKPVMALMIILSIIPLWFCGYSSTNTGNSSANADMHKWQKTYGQVGADSAQAIDQTTDNGYVIAGYTFQYWSGNNDMWVFKIDSFGELVWEKLLGIPGSSTPDYAYAVKATPDGGCVAAGESRLYDILDEVGLTPSYKFNMYIVKLDSTGTTEWEKRYGGADYDRANSITTTTDGGYIVAGSTQSYADGYTPPPHNKKDAWIIKLDKNGDKQWEVVHGGAEGDGINSIIQTSDGGYAAAGFTASKGAGGYDCWVLKLNSKGTIVWEKTYGGQHADIANSIVQTSDGGYAVAGETWSFGAGKTDFLCLKLASDGTLQWLNTYGGSKFERARSIRQTPDGGYLMAGYTSSYGAGNHDFWIVRTDSTGKVKWTETQGGASCDEANSLQLTNDGGFIVAGNTSSYGAGEIDAWVIKYDTIK